MKFEIVNKSIQDRNVDNMIIKMLQYFSQKYSDKAKEIKDKHDLKIILLELINYLEIGLKSKYSINFCVLVSEYPCYALKYEKKSLFILKYQNYEILIFKPPVISIPGLFNSKLDKNQIEQLQEYIKENENCLIKQHIKIFKYFNKSLIEINQTGFEKFNEKLMLDVVVKNIGYFQLFCNSEKEISKLALSIQNDISNLDEEYKYNIYLL
jgi:hypothetical protein